MAMNITQRQKPNGLIDTIHIEGIFLLGLATSLPSHVMHSKTKTIEQKAPAKESFF